MITATEFTILDHLFAFVGSNGRNFFILIFLKHFILLFASFVMFKESNNLLKIGYFSIKLSFIEYFFSCNFILNVKD